MALFKISKGLAKNLMANVPYAKEGFAYFTTDDGKLYIDITGDGTSAQAEKGINRICLNSDYADRLKINSNATKAKDNQVARFNGNDGSLQGSDVTIDDEGALVATKIYATDNRVNETTGKTEIADVNTEKYDFGVVGDSYFQGKIDIKGDITLNGEIGGTKITKGNNADILGTTKNNTIFSNQLTLKQGAVFSGSAQEAGLITRGICGISTPTGDGSCNKDNLYINYDGDNFYKTNRHIILQAGEVGENYGNNLYQYAAARGDAVHDWALDNFYVKSNIDEKFQTWLELSDALIYQGTIAGGKSSPGNFTFAANRGDVYKVSVAGYINGQPVEVGDLFICNTDTTKPASLSNYTTIQANWDIINTNVDGAAFIGTGKTLTDKSLVIANGTKGQLKSSGAVGSATQPFYINNSGVPIAINYTANRLYYPSSTTTFTAGNHYISNDKIQINGTSTPGYNLQVAGTTNLAGETTSKSIVPADNDTYNLGTTKKQWKNIYGKLIGESYEAYLQWGGKNLSGRFAPIDAVLNPYLGANRLACIKGNGVNIEYSNDDGATWKTYTQYDQPKTELFTTSGSFRIAGPDKNVGASSKSKLRITIDGVDGGIYTQLNKLHIYITSNYSNNCTVSMESYDYNSSTSWHMIINKQPISGWSGWNVLNFTLPGSGAFGGTNSSTHQRKIRLTFANDSVTSGHEKEGLQVLKIFGYGGVGWTTVNNLGLTGVPYTYDWKLAVSFPNTVKASSFIGNITGNADTASKWKTPRTFKIGNCSRTIDGTSDITWPLNEIGVASHNHDSLYVKKTGDTMTGLLKTNGNIENQGEAKFIHPTYCPDVEDTAENIGCAFKASRGHFNQMNVNEIYLPATTTTNYEGNKISFKTYSGGNNGAYANVSEVAQINTTGLKVGSSSIGTNGYIEGTWLKTTDAGNKAGDFATIDSSGWIYKRTPAQVLSDIGAAPNSHNHDSNYVKKTGDTMTGQLAIDKAGYGFRVNNGSTGYIELSRDNGGAQLYGLWDCIKQKWIVQSDGTNVSFHGNADSANLALADINGLQIDTNYLKLSGGTMNGSINCFLPATTSTATNTGAMICHGLAGGNNGMYVGNGDTDGSVLGRNGKANLIFKSWYSIGFVDGCSSTNSGMTMTINVRTGELRGSKLWGAVWNDYAEFRKGDTIESGKCVIEVGDDTLITSTERMMPGANITSDTFGFAIGKTEQAKTPIAVSGRVLAYPYESREEFKKNIGRPVCSGPNGTVSIMTDEEYRNKGYCAIGTISAVPDYEEWGTGKVKVNGRVWIKVF